MKPDNKAFKFAEMVSDLFTWRFFSAMLFSAGFFTYVEPTLAQLILCGSIAAGVLSIKEEIR